MHAFSATCPADTRHDIKSLMGLLQYAGALPMPHRRSFRAAVDARVLLPVAADGCVHVITINTLHATLRVEDSWRGGTKNNCVTS
jgi:hypothetical protein